MTSTVIHRLSPGFFLSLDFLFILKTNLVFNGVVSPDGPFFLSSVLLDYNGNMKVFTLD